MSDRPARLRTALLGIMSALDEAPADYAPVRKQLEPFVDAVFSGQDMSQTLMQVSTTSSLIAYWSAARGPVSAPQLLEQLAKLYSLVLDDPVRVSALDAAIPRDIAPRSLKASGRPPLSYVLDKGAVFMPQDPDPDPERETAGSEQNDDEDVDTESPEPPESAPDEAPASAAHSVDYKEPQTAAPQSANQQPALMIPGWEVDVEAAKPQLLYRYYREIAGSAFDQMSLIARHRVERRLSECLDEEEWIVQLCDAIANVGCETLAAARRHFIAQLKADPYDLWGVVFFLSCVEGLPAVQLLDELVGMLVDEFEIAATTVADAVSQGTSPELTTLLRDWAVSPSGTKRAVALAVSCRRQEIEGEAAVRGLCDPSRVVRLITLHGLRDLNVGSPELAQALRPMLRNLWSTPDPEVAWQALLTACWFGVGEGYRAWRNGEISTLGKYELDMIVLAGDVGDLPSVKTFVETHDLNGRTLRLLARYGHPAVIPVLIHGLKDEDLQNDAAIALELMLGPRVDPNVRLEPNAWASAAKTMKMPKDKRIWFGEPCRPSTFLRTVERGRCSLVELEQALEEIRVRTCRRDPTALHGWHAANQARLDQKREELRRADGQYPAGSWTCALALAE